MRPVRSIPGMPAPLADPRGKQLDFVIIRESIEGLFALRDVFFLRREPAKPLAKEGLS